MSLIHRVNVTRRFQRSVRIDTDVRDPQALEGYICPRSAADVLTTMARHVSETGQGAFTWTGPYGSGKSSLVVALSALLSGNAQRRALAARVLGPELSKALEAALPPKSQGWRVLPVVGRRDDPVQVIGEALTAHGYVRLPDHQAAWTETGVLKAVSAAAAESPRTSGGLIIFLDEMGKFLEGAAQEGVDIYLFQQLAEIAARSGRRLIIVGILHQAFQEYASRLSRDLRDEWTKVQGRFVDLPVNVAGDEQLELLSRAISTDRWPVEPEALSVQVAEHIRSNRPGASRDLAKTLDATWPLHPVVAALLGPISRRRFGQNQRSLFGFLNSAEPYGFQDFLRDAGDTDRYGPDRLFDYLRINLESSILASPDGHRWSTAVEAIERCEAIGGSGLHLQLLKTIALIDLFRERSGLNATDALLADCVAQGTQAELAAALEQLRQWSFIIFRRHLGAFAIFAGSDFDIEQALTETLETVREVSFKELRALAGLQPVVAKRHYHETGSLRWFDVDLVPLNELGHHVQAPAPANGAIGRFLLVIPISGETPAKARKACRERAAAATYDVVIGLSRQEWNVLELAREFLAMNRILEERPELSGDQVARREVQARLGAARTRLEQSLQRAFDSAEWCRKGVEPTRYSYAELNSLASDLAGLRYPDTPLLPNELVNRIKPSSNAVAAQKALLKRMVSYEGQPRLGIEQFPAEGGLFESLLARSGLYRETEQGWRFVAPEPDHDPARLAPLWEAGVAFLRENQRHTVSMAELYTVWRGQPFGVRDGLLPIIGVAFLLSRRDQLAFYREGIFQARFTDVEVDYLTIDPGLIHLRWMDLSTLSRRILSGLAEVVRDLDDGNRLVNLEPIDVARGLVAIHDALRPWAKRTTRLSANALRIRDLFKHAQDPNKFLFDDIPALFRDAVGANGDVDLDQVVSRVRDGLLELTQAYSEMLSRLRQLMLSELQVHNTSAHALAELRARAENIHQLGGDFRLNAFISRLTQFTGQETDVEGIASLAANKPPRDWVDVDLDQAALELTDLAQKFVRVEAFARVKGRPDKRQALAVIVGLNGRPTPMAEDFHVTDAERAEVQVIVDRVAATLGKSDTKRRHLILAALAELSSQYMINEPAKVEPIKKKRAARA